MTFLGACSRSGGAEASQSAADAKAKARERQEALLASFAAQQKQVETPCSLKPLARSGFRVQGSGLRVQGSGFRV
jgi:hypothetical protein